MTDLEPQLEIIKSPEISINDLMRYRELGFSALRSAHVGNFSPYNLTIADAGIPILCVDHNITGIDRNYMPESINTQTAVETIAPIGQLTCRTLVGETANSSYLDDLHQQSVRQAVANAEIFTNTEYLRRNEPVVGEIVRLALAESPAVFNRLVLSSGRTCRQPDAATMVESRGIMQLNDDPRAEKAAVLMPNILDMMANFIIEALESGEAVQYHLSGPDFVKYIDGLLPDLQRLYDCIKRRASFGPRLPARLTVRMVPTAEARFATTDARRPLLDDALAAVRAADEEIAVNQPARKAFFTSTVAKEPAARKAFVAELRTRETALEREAAEKLALLPELFIDPGTPGFITQYDAANEGGLYAAPINREASMADLASLTSRMKRLLKRALP